MVTQIKRFQQTKCKTILILVDGVYGGRRGGQKTEHQNFQVGTLNCGDTSLTELKNIWVKSLALKLTPHISGQF